MGKIWFPGSGGGADLDVITATASDVRRNKVIVDKEGDPLAGAMNEQAGGTFTPGTSDRVLVPANTFVTSAIGMKGETNLVQDNVIKGKTIFNVIGNRNYFDVENNVIYNGNVFYNSYKPSGTKDTYKGQGISCGTPYNSYNSVALRIYQDTSDTGAEANVILKKGNYRKVSVVITKYVGQMYETVWMEIWRESDGEIWFYPFRGNVSGTYHTIIEVLGVSSAIISKNNEWA